MAGKADFKTPWAVLLLTLWVTSARSDVVEAPFTPFTSFGTSCQFQTLATEILDGVLYVTFFNENIEVSTEERISGPATTTPTVAIDLATGDAIGISGTANYHPTAVSGSWETIIEGAKIENGRILKIFVSGVGTGDLEGLGIRLSVNLNAKASTSPPHLQCEAAGGPFLSHGKIFHQY